jgi:iron complex outermembrane receptor protein
MLTLAVFAAVNSTRAEVAPQDPLAAKLPEVVVTAERREQSLQSVPLSVTAVTSATLAQAGVVEMRGVAQLTPGLAVEETSGAQAQSYRIRGVGSHPNIPTFEPDVALFIDGVYMPRSGLGVDDLVDVARVEVLEGPQSTLYGKNATAGVINVVTNRPTQGFEASLEASLSDLDSSDQALVGRVVATVSGPIDDHVRARFSAVSYNQQASYRNLEPGAPDANDMHRYAVRGEIEADLSQDTTLRVAAMRSQIYGAKSTDADLLYYTFSPPNNAARLVFGPLGRAFNILPCPDNDPGDRIICTTAPAALNTFRDLLSATLDSKVGDNTLTSITAVSDYGSKFVQGDAAQVLLPIVTYYDRQRGLTFSQELRLTSPTGRTLEWLTGLYFQHAEFARGDDGDSPTFVLGAATPFVPLPDPRNPPAPTSCGLLICLGQPGDRGYEVSKARSNYEAVFAQATYHFDDRFALTFGGRAQAEQKRASVVNSNAIAPAEPLGLNLLTLSLTPPSSSAAFRHGAGSFTWNATGEYHPSQHAMFYLTASRGAKSFGYNIGFGSVAPAARPFKGEYVNNYEAGVKATLWEGRARVSAAAFHATYHNYQSAGFVGLQFLVDNAERMVVNGAEASGGVALGRGFTVDAAVTYVDAQYVKYTQGSCFFGEAPNNAAGSGCDLSHKSLPLAPRWRTALGLQHAQPSAAGEIYGRVDWAWQSSEFTNTNLDPRSRQPPYSLVNGRVGLMVGHGVDLAVWANNLFNHTASFTDGVTNLFGSSDPGFQRFVERPREYGVTVRKSF